MYLFEHGTKTLCQISQFWAGMDSFLWLIGEAIFHMLPVGICWSVTKKMGTTQMLGNRVRTYFSFWTAFKCLIL